MVQISKPVLYRTVTFNSLQAQRAQERVFARTAIALYRTDVILRIIGDPDEAESVETVVTDQIQSTLKDIKDETARVKALMKNSGIAEMPSYTNPCKYEIEISSPQVATYLQVLTGIDQLMSYVDALWLAGVIDNKQRSETTYSWQRRVMRLGRRLINIELRAYRAAQNRGKDAEVRDAAGDPSDIGDDSVMREDGDDGQAEAMEPEATEPTEAPAKKPRKAATKKAA